MDTLRTPLVICAGPIPLCFKCEEKITNLPGLQVDAFKISDPSSLYKIIC